MGSLTVNTHFSSEDSSSPPDTAAVQSQISKRKATEAGLNSRGSRPAKSVKRRASKACQCCRARKVRCNVVEHGPPCTNCRLDEVECIVSESKRKKKWTASSMEASPQSGKGDVPHAPTTFHVSTQPSYEALKRATEHTPHVLYQNLSKDIGVANAHARHSMYSPHSMISSHYNGTRSPTSEMPPLITSLVSPVTPSYSLPMYIKPLPSKLNIEDIQFLSRKGALTIPSVTLRDELLKNFVEFVYPYMPLLDIHDMVATIDRNDGSTTMSLLLFQAIMFSAVATVDIRHLKAAGYSNRRDARRDFFQRTRLLYDFDIEIDRVSLIQSLLLMTYWYETPDDQKDSHHWMGIAVSLSHTIGLHRNSEKSNAIDGARKKLWKRIWWSIYIRDRLVALGMRRPTRIKEADFDVPMLTVDDFEATVLPEGPSCIPATCKIMRNLDKQRQLAIMCIEKAKLCVCMSHVLSVQYSVLNNNHGAVDDEGSSKTTVRLTVKKGGPESSDVQACDDELQNWRAELPREAEYEGPESYDANSGDESIFLNLSLLHMIYHATMSALHRPQVLPSTATPPRSMQTDLIDRSRKAVRLASAETTSMAHTLFNLDMVRFLPTTGTTVLLPAIIMHLLDVKAPDEATRRTALQGFCQCMQIMGKLRDIYASADYSTAFLEAAIRKAEITFPPRSDEVKENRGMITSAQGLVDVGRRLQLVPPAPEANTLTPPPDDQRLRQDKPLINENEMATQLNSYLASTPPDSEHMNPNDLMNFDHMTGMEQDVELDFDSLINLDAAGDGWTLDDSAYAVMSSENAGFPTDMEWLKGVKEGTSTPMRQ